jgi:hypothetical protein
MTNGDNVPIAKLFPSDSIAARFVLSMGMARNDLERALRDVVDAVEAGRPDFSDRVRLATGHLVDALSAYGEDEDVRKLTRRLPPDAQTKLKAARGTLQKAGQGALPLVRDNTFHYPSPRSNYNPTSDQRLAEALTRMGR